jgi:hypothetical protein
MREVTNRIDAIGVVLDGVEGYSLLSMWYVG